MTSGTKFLDPKAVSEAIVEIVEKSREAGVKVALIGGVAMVLRGSDRLTKVVDVVADGLLPGFDFQHQLSFGGVATLSPRGRHPVDIVIRDDDYRELYEAALDGAVDEGDLPIKVVAPEYLAAMKLATRHDKDELDLKTLIASEVLPTTRTREIIKHHLGPHAAREFDDLCAEVAWLKSIGRL